MTAEDLKGIVHSDRGIMSGTAVFVGTRVPLQNLIDYLTLLRSLQPGQIVRIGPRARVSSLPPMPRESSIRGQERRERVCGVELIALL